MTLPKKSRSGNRQAYPDKQTDRRFPRQRQYQGLYLPARHLKKRVRHADDGNKLADSRGNGKEDDRFDHTFYRHPLVRHSFPQQNS